MGGHIASYVKNSSLDVNLSVRSPTLTWLVKPVPFALLSSPSGLVGEFSGGGLSSLGLFEETSGFGASSGFGVASGFRASSEFEVASGLFGGITGVMPGIGVGGGGVGRVLRCILERLVP